MRRKEFMSWSCNSKKDKSSFHAWLMVSAIAQFPRTLSNACRNIIGIVRLKSPMNWHCQRSAHKHIPNLIVKRRQFSSWLKWTVGQSSRAHFLIISRAMHRCKMRKRDFNKQNQEINYRIKAKITDIKFNADESNFQRPFRYVSDFDTFQFLVVD